MWTLEVLEFLFKQLEGMAVKCLDDDALENVAMVRQAAREILAEREAIVNQSKPVRHDAITRLMNAEEATKHMIQQLSETPTCSNQCTSVGMTSRLGTPNRPRGVF